MNRKNKKRIWLWIVLAALALAALAAVWTIRDRRAASPTAGYTSYTVGTGGIVSSVTGSGVLGAPGTLSVDLPDGILVSEVPAKLGDAVRSGDTLAVLDADSLLDKAAELAEQLASQNRSVARAKREAEALYAPIAGRVKYLPVRAGSDVVQSVAQYGALALLSTDELMYAEFDTSAPAAPMSEVTIKWEGGSVTGEVAARTENGVRVTFSDRKVPYLAQVEAYLDGEPLGAGTACINAPLAIYAVGGTLEKAHIKLNESVRAGAKLFTLYNCPSEAYRQAVSARDDTAALLETVLIYRAYPHVVAPEDGVISAVSCAEGQTSGGAGSASGKSAAFTLATGGASVLTIEVDELDIGAISIGQTAAVRLDALSAQSFSGTVARISALGAAAGSITTYDVEIRLEPDTRLLAGMHGSATIRIGQVENVAVIPLGYILEDANGSFVYLGDALAPTYIATGASDGAFAEVVSGLKAGDVIWRAKTASEFPFMMMGAEERESFRGAYGQGD